MRFYEDIEIGEEFQSESYTVREQEIIDFALQFDPRAIHTDVQAGLESEFGGLIASGIHIMALAQIGIPNNGANSNSVWPRLWRDALRAATLCQRYYLRRAATYG